MEKIGSEAARRHLPALLKRAHDGKPLMITKRGEPYAVLVSPDEWRSPSGKSGLLALRGSGKALWDDSPGASVADMRDEWQ